MRLVEPVRVGRNRIHPATLRVSLYVRGNEHQLARACVGDITRSRRLTMPLAARMSALA